VLLVLRWCESCAYHFYQRGFKVGFFPVLKFSGFQTVDFEIVVKESVKIYMCDSPKSRSIMERHILVA
jgi:hypothetical protein